MFAAGYESYWQRQEIRPCLPYKMAEAERLTLDPISAELAGKLRVAALTADAKKTHSQQWINFLREALFPSDIKNWCGRKHLTWNPSTNETRPSFKNAVDTLGLSVLDEVKPAMGRGADRAFVSIFMVPKEGNVGRAIGNCKALNTQFSKGPFLSFPSTEDIFRIITFFGQAPVFFITADFRHWFYQIPLPKAVRKWFTVKCDKNFKEFKVWPMGFSWSPFVAQGLSMLIGRLAIDRLKYAEAFSPLDSEENLPPFWIIGMGKNGSKPTRENIAGFIGFWYDNLLVVTSNPQMRDDLQTNIAAITKHYHALWKAKEGTSTTGHTEKAEEAFEQSVDEVTYLGITFKKSNNLWVWNHASKNRKKWKSFCETALTIKEEERTWRLLSKLTGLMTWHWSVMGADRSHWSTSIKISQWIGKWMTMNMGWDSSLPKTTDANEHWKVALEFVSSLPDQGPYRRVFSKETKNFGEVLLFASDACSTSGAWLNLRTLERANAVFSRQEQEKHITWKETYWAIKALETAIQSCPQHSLVKLALDNTTAVSSLEKGLVGFDESLDSSLIEVKRKFNAKGCAWRAYYIPGELQPADEPSRMVDTIVTEKVNKTIEFLEKTTLKWFQWTGQGERTVGKRVREEAPNREE